MEAEMEAAQIKTSAPVQGPTPTIMANNTSNGSIAQTAGNANVNLEETARFLSPFGGLLTFQTYHEQTKAPGPISTGHLKNTPPN